VASTGVAGAAAKGCPTASVVSSAAGTSLAKKGSGGAAGVYVCTYQKGQSFLEITLSPTPTVTSATFKRAMQADAKGEKASGFKSLSGLGSEAFTWAYKRDGFTSTAVAVFLGKSEFVAFATIPENKLVAVAQKVVG
jgi:hypothetical protein